MSSVGVSTFQSKLDFNFDAFTLKTAKQTTSLLLVLCKSIGVHKLVQKTDDELIPYFEDIAAHMPANPYHNLRHITDVTQFSTAVVAKTKLFKWLPPNSIVALFFGSVCHDLEHPGSSNKFVINEATEIAKKFPGKCPLEHHHVAWCKQLMSKHKILSNMKSEDSSEVMKTIELLILSTDMAKHFDIIKEFKGTVEKAKTDFKSVVDSLRKGLLQVVIKSADVSNQTRAYDTATKWNVAVYTEFFREGDADRAKGRKLNPLHDRHTTVMAKETVGFINFIVRPLIELLSQGLQAVERSGAPLSADAIAPIFSNLDKNVKINAENAKTAKPGLPEE